MNFPSYDPATRLVYHTNGQHARLRAVLECRRKAVEYEADGQPRMAALYRDSVSAHLDLALSNARAKRHAKELLKVKP